MDFANLKHVYVSSARRGFMAIVGRPSCVDTPTGSTGRHLLVSVKRIERRVGAWHDPEPDMAAQIWLRRAWEEAVSLSGSEPWRIYQFDAAEIARHLDSGKFTDDLRGFKNRCEPWQPMEVDGEGNHISYVDPARAAVWERTDGWRVTLSEGAWLPDGSRCNADRSILEYSQDHFLEFPSGLRFPSAADAMDEVDRSRPWE